MLPLRTVLQGPGRDELENNETFVRPFTKQVFRLKEKEYEVVFKAGVTVEVEI